MYSFFNLGARWGWVVNPTLRALYLQKRDAVTIVWETGWVQGPIWTRKTEIRPTHLNAIIYAAINFLRINYSVIIWHFVGKSPPLNGLLPTFI